MGDTIYGFQINGGTFTGDNFHNHQGHREQAQTSPAYEQLEHVTRAVVASRSKVFVACSQKDRKWMERLHIHFKPLERSGLELWDDAQIPVGSKWEEELQAAMQSFTIAILVVSQDFLASDLLMVYVLPKLLAHAKAEGATIMPIIVAPCELKNSGIEVFQAVNAPAKPLSEMTKTAQEEMLVKLVQAVHQRLEQVQA